MALSPPIPRRKFPSSGNRLELDRVHINPNLFVRRLS
jgi:hypothetical protein